MSGADKITNKMTAIAAMRVNTVATVHYAVTLFVVSCVAMRVETVRQ